MMRRTPPVLILVLLLGSALAAAQDRPTRETRPQLRFDWLPAHGAKGKVSRCDACHTPEGWSTPRFAHERTGYVLEGAHQKAPCRSCHVQSFEEPLGQLCAGCHRDLHAGQFGARCEGCHGTQDWKPFFTADAHRRAAFRLGGKHALIPCTECHGAAKDRNFLRSTVSCIGCHQADYLRTAVGGAPDHAAMGFSTVCAECHSPFQFKGARFPEHDRCFVITRGAHANVLCDSCHSSVPRTRPLACNSGTPACINCHAHSCAKSDVQHRQVPGYECRDSGCVACHRLDRGGG